MAKRGRPPAESDESTFAGRVGGRIRARRLKIGITVVDAAKAAGVSVPAWYHFESGRHLPLDRLPAIAAALRCRVRELIPADV